MSTHSIACPTCGVDVAVASEAAVDTMCPTCGSSIAIVPEETVVITKRTEETRFLGPFHLLETIGRGAYGQVWKARDQRLNRLVAVKTPRDAVLDDVERESFLKDARAAARLQHPHIVPVHEVGEQDGTVYIVSSLIEGITLADRLSAGPPTIKEAVHLATTITDAVHHAHEQGIVHRDLKPSNILLDADGEPHVIDFGLAKEGGAKVAMTLSGQILGTPAYMSPEQARGRSHEVDARCDVYSLGVILFEMLTGERPFRGNVRMMLKQVVEDDPPNPRHLNGAIPTDLATITLKCLEKEPGKRYDSAEHLANDLRRFTNGEPIKARPPSLFDRTAKTLRRNWKAFATAAAFIATVSAVVVVAFLQIVEERNKAVAAAKTAEEAAEREAKARGEAEIAAEKEAEVRRIAFASLRKTLDTLANDKELHTGPFAELRERLLQTAESTFLDLQEHQESLAADEFEDMRIDLAWLAVQLGDAKRAETILEGGRVERVEPETAKPLTPEQLRQKLTRLEIELRVASRKGETKRADALVEATADLLHDQARILEDDLDLKRRALHVTAEACSLLDSRGQYQKSLDTSRLADPLIDEKAIPKELLVAVAWVWIERSDAFLGLARFEDAITERQKLADLLVSRREDFDVETQGFAELNRNVHNGIGNARNNLGQAALAKPEYEKAIEWADKVAAFTPTSYDPAFSTGMTRFNLAGCLFFGLGRTVEAQDAYLATIDVWQQLHDREPENWQVVHWLAAAKNNLAMTHASRGDAAEAERLAREAIYDRERFQGAANGEEWANGNWRTYHANHYIVLGNALIGQAKITEGIAARVESCRLLAKVLEGDDAGEPQRTYFVNQVLAAIRVCDQLAVEADGLSDLFTSAVRIADELAATSDDSTTQMLAVGMRLEGALHGELEGEGLGRCELLGAAFDVLATKFPDAPPASLRYIVETAAFDPDCASSCTDLLRERITACCEKTNWRDPGILGALAEVERVAGNREMAIAHLRKAATLCDDGANVPPNVCAAVRQQLRSLERADSP